MGHRQEKLIYCSLLESRLCVLWNYFWVLDEEEPFFSWKLVCLGSASSASVLSGVL